MCARLWFRSLVAAAALVACSYTGRAEVVIDLVTVGNPGNTGELTGAGAGGFGTDRISGAVDYIYDIAKHEVTAGQYTEFLNAVAKTDTYGLYNPQMWSREHGCKIEQTGSPGTFSYTVAEDRADRPVNGVSWGNAARFANWMHNRQPSGSQSLSTTENGSYFLNGATTDAELMAVTRNANATWAIPSEDEWYKSAYHMNNGMTGDYFLYPTSNDSLPSNDLLTPDGGNNANFDQDGYTMGSPYFATVVGEFENSASPYGTFDQGGNIAEWTETAIDDEVRNIRGGHFLYNSSLLESNYRGISRPTYDGFNAGFRLASVPEPSSIALAVIAGLSMAGIGLYRWRKAPTK